MFSKLFGRKQRIVEVFEKLTKIAFGLNDIFEHPLPEMLEATLRRKHQRWASDVVRHGVYCGALKAKAETSSEGKLVASKFLNDLAAKRLNCSSLSDEDIAVMYCAVVGIVGMDNVLNALVLSENPGLAYLDFYEEKSSLVDYDALASTAGFLSVASWAGLKRGWDNAEDYRAWVKETLADRLFDYNDQTFMEFCAAVALCR